MLLLTRCALPEGAWSLLGHDLLGGIPDARVRCLPRAGGNLQTRLDHIGWRHQRGSRNTRNGTSSQQGDWTIVAILVGQCCLGVRISGEVDGREVHVTQQTSLGTLVQSKEAQLPDHGQCTDLGAAGNFTCHLQSNLNNFQRISEDDLRSTTTTTGQDLTPDGNVAAFVCALVAHKIVDRQFDGLLGCHAHQLRQQTTIETEHTLVANDLSDCEGEIYCFANIYYHPHKAYLLEAIPGVPVGHLTDHGPRALILHARLHQIDGVDHSSASSYEREKVIQ